MDFKRKMKTRDAKENPLTVMFLAVFVMFVISGLLLLLLAAILYKMELGESVVKMGIVAIYVISGLLGGVVTGKMMRERKFVWGLLTGLLYFVILFAASAVMKGGFEMDLTKVLTTMILCGASGMAGGMVS